MDPLLRQLFSSGQFLSFLSLLVIGFLYIVCGGIFGAIFGDHDGGDAEGGDFDGGHGHDLDPNVASVSMFSPKVLAIFLVGFGAAGCIATFYAANVILATLAGLGAGVVLGALALFGMRALYRQNVSSQVPIAATLGRTALVTQRIPPDGIGTVGLTVNGQYQTYEAIADETIERDARVHIAEIHGAILFVKELYPANARPAPKPDEGLAPAAA